MPTQHRNVRVDDDPWLPGKKRAQRLHGSLAAVIRASIRAYVAGELDEIITRYLDGAAPAGSSAGEGLQTEHLPFLPMGTRSHGQNPAASASAACLASASDSGQP
jgi:hypothetical protein